MSDIFSDVPNEIVVEILSFLPIRDLCSVSLVNKNFWSFIQDDYVWHSICAAQFPTDYVSEELKKIVVEEAVSEDEQQVNAVNKTNGKKLYKRLSRHISFIAKERGVVWLDCQQGGGNNHHWKTLEDPQSEFGKIVFLNYVWWFDVSSTLKVVLPGTYYIIWRLRVKSHYYINSLNFYTAVVEKTEDEDEETIIHEYSHVPPSSIFSDIASINDWVECRLPYKLVIPEQKVIDGKLIYHSVHLKIFDHNNHKSGLFIDYVRLREHDRSNNLLAI